MKDRAMHRIRNIEAVRQAVTVLVARGLMTPETRKRVHEFYRRMAPDSPCPPGAGQAG